MGQHQRPQRVEEPAAAARRPPPRSVPLCRLHVDPRGSPARHRAPQQREEKTRESGGHGRGGLAAMDRCHGDEVPEPAAHLPDHRGLAGTVRAHHPDDRSAREQRLRRRPAPQRAPGLAPRAPAPCQARTPAHEPSVRSQPRCQRSTETEATDPRSPRLDGVREAPEEREFDARKMLLQQAAHLLIVHSLAQPPQLVGGRRPVPRDEGLARDGVVEALADHEQHQLRSPRGHVHPVLRLPCAAQQHVLHR